MDYLQFAILNKYSEKEKIEALYNRAERFFLIRWIESIKEFRNRRNQARQTLINKLLFKRQRRRLA